MSFCKTGIRHVTDYSNTRVTWLSMPGTHGYVVVQKVFVNIPILL